MQEGNLKQMSQCVYSISCERSRIYIGETGRPLAVRLHEHRHSLKEDLLEKSKLAQHSYEDDHRVRRNEAKKKTTPWSESASELYRPSYRRLSAK
jgi:predicted GIY-YIG superfamily endonuclease